MVGSGLSKNVGQWRKNLKLHWIKHPKTVPKRQNLKSHIWSFTFDFRFSSIVF